MGTEQLDLNLICRTCKSVTPQMQSLYENMQTTNQNARIDEMLMACASIQVALGDGLPSLICNVCMEQLKNAFTFKQKCEEIDANLREYVKSLKVINEIKEELQNSDFMDSLPNILNSDDTNKGCQSSSGTPQPNQTDFIQIMENNQMLLTCHECRKVFTTLEGLRCHKRMHVGGMFKCKQCDKEYTRLTHLQRHEQSHGRRKVHVCRICNKTLTRLEHLKRHLVTHLREKPYSCQTCNRGFNRIEHLHNHAPKCKGDHVHICNVCNKVFYREDSLDLHRKLHENQEPVLPTLENLENIEQHYYEIDYDANVEFSDNSDVEDCFEPHVEVRENFDENTVQEVADLSASAPVNEVAPDAILPLNDKPGEVEAPLADIAEEMDDKIELKHEIICTTSNDCMDMDVDGANDVMMDDGGADDTDSTDSEYLPTKSSSSPPKVKRGRGRPRKHPIGGPLKIPGRVRARARHLHTFIKKEEPAEDEETGEFPCPACGVVFKTMRFLDRHARKSHDGLKVHKCTVCNKEFGRSTNLKRHMMSHSTDKPFQCQVCTKNFSRRDHLTQHQKLHDRQQDFECDICQKPFTRADHLAKHKASKHGIGDKITGEKKFECHICNKSFTTEKYRDVHVKGHNGEKQYQCKTCQKCFLSKSHLTEHVKFHNDHSKKFLCSECGQRFIRNDYLVIHMRRHRGEKPFKCKFCGKGFPRTTDLTVHERYHTGEKTHLCTICGRGFGRAYNLTVHMRTHTGEKPYQCTYCDAAFAQGNDLKAHVRRHTGERFQCELCTESFLMGYLLTQHKRSVHGLNVVSNIRRLKPVHKVEENSDEPPPIEIPLPKPVVPVNMFDNLHAQLTVAQLHLARE